jgi:hypothetical protein
LVSDGELKYSMRVIHGVNCLVSSREDGDQTIIGLDESKGISVEKISGMPIIIKEYFVSGVLAGKVRSLSKITDSGAEEISRKYSYDEHGTVIRAETYRNNMQIIYDGIQKTIRVYNSGSQSPVWSKSLK